MKDSTWAVVVGRTGPNAKSRLGDMLDADERSALAVAMLTDVLHATSRADLSGTIAVVDPPGDPIKGAEVIADPGGGLIAAVGAGVNAALGRGAATVVVLAGDLPLLGPDDVTALVAAADGPRAVVVATDRHRTGTNALVLRPPTVIAPLFGPNSGPRHLAAAAAAGASVRRIDRERVALDIDTPADLAELLRRRPGGATAVALARHVAA